MFHSLLYWAKRPTSQPVDNYFHMCLWAEFPVRLWCAHVTRKWAMFNSHTNVLIQFLGHMEKEYMSSLNHYWNDGEQTETVEMFFFHTDTLFHSIGNEVLLVISSTLFNRSVKIVLLPPRKCCNIISNYKIKAIQTKSEKIALNLLWVCLAKALNRNCVRKTIYLA